MFEIEKFIEECRELQRKGDNQTAIRELLTREVSDPAAVLNGLGEPERAGVQKLYNDEDLTILNIVWAPGMTLKPHNHQMWAVIGIYTGREDNIFWRRVPGDRQGRVEAAGAKSLSAMDCVPLGKDIIHSVTNPLSRLTGAIHIYGGDFFTRPRSEWDAESLVESAYNVEKNMRLFEEANAGLAAA